MKDILIALFSGGAITYVLGWMAGRKKNNADLEGIRLKNIEGTIEIYERVHKELKEQLENLSDKCLKLSFQIDQLQTENKSLKLEIHMLNKSLNEKNNERS